MNNTKIIREDINLLKGFAILAVVLYHMGEGFLPSGYLGVDAFFVINGYFIIPKIITDVDKSSFKYFSFLENRAIRLLPLLLIISAIVLLVGYIGMLPDDYENLCESVIASDLFLNNILSAITVVDYWKVTNAYRPLMHTWYLGILFQFYIVFPLIVLATKKITNMMRTGFIKNIELVLISLTLLSFLLYLDVNIPNGDKFYYLPYRFYEITLGGMAGMFIYHRQGRLLDNSFWSVCGFIILLLTIYSSMLPIWTNEINYDLVDGIKASSSSLVSQHVLLIATVMLTLFFVVSNNMQNNIVRQFVKIRLLYTLGIMSYSIFLWHQPILAFYRYFFTNELSFSFIIVFFFVIIAVSYASFYIIEKKIKVCTRTRVIGWSVFLLTIGFSFFIFMHAGVVRDVPELNIQKGNVHRNMHAEYNDRIYGYDKDFVNCEGKRNVLIVGNSFARDWANILLESKMADSINLSYIYKIEESRTHMARIRNSDYIFYFGWKHDVPSFLWENKKKTASVWGIGTKNFGESNGIIYKDRNKIDYFDLTIKINPVFFEINQKLESEWKDNYIDLLGLISCGDGTVPVFSDEHHFISQDCQHLTEGGGIFLCEENKF